MFKRVLIIGLSLYLPFFFMTVVWGLLQKKDQLNSIIKIEQRGTQDKKNHFLDVCETLIYKTQYWSSITYPENFDPNGKDSLFIGPYLDFIEGMTDYDQFRFIDLEGNEFFRYQRTPDDRMEIGKLQSKANRDYFIRGMSLKKDEIFLSPIELNMEYGVIEKPYKPVMRGVGPIFNEHGKQIGLVVINYRIKRIFELLKLHDTTDFLFLVDEKKRILTSNISENNLAFMTSMDPTDSLLQRKLESVGINTLKDTSFVQKGSIWIQRSIDLGQDLGTLYGRFYTTPKIITQSHWSIIEQIPSDVIDTKLNPLYRNFILFNAIAFVLIFLIAYTYDGKQVQKTKFLDELKEKNENLSKNEQRLQATGRQMIKINKRLGIRNKQLEEFNYVVSHNLRAPVTSMSVIMNMIQKTTDPKEVSELLPKLEIICKNIVTLTEDIRTYITILNQQDLKVENIDLTKLIEEQKSGFASTLIEKSEFNVITELNDWHTLKFSKFYLKSIIQNFISNAIKYRKEGIKSYILFKSSWEGGNKVLYVKDNGIGINLERHGKNLFKLYKRFHRNKSGKGMGLFIIKSQLEALEATIDVESKEGEGTIFKITFHQL